MYRAKKFYPIIIVILLIAPATSYVGEGGTLELVQCINNEDDDLSGFIDEEDPACTSPFHLDDNEYNTYDTGITYEISGTPDEDVPAPHVFFGSDIQRPTSSLGREVLGSDTYNESTEELELVFMDRSDVSWGGDENTTSVIDTSDLTPSWNVKEHPNERGDVLVPPPHPEASLTRLRCGDSLTSFPSAGISENTAVLKCPEDYGMPANQYDDNLYDGHGESEKTVTDALGTFDAGSISNLDKIGDDTESRVDFEHALEAKEHEPNEYSEDLRTGQDNELYDYEEWNNGPNFFLNPDKTTVETIYPVKNIRELLEVDHYEIDNERHSGVYHEDQDKGGEGVTCDVTIGEESWLDDPTFEVDTDVDLTTNINEYRRDGTSSASASFTSHEIYTETDGTSYEEKSDTRGSVDLDVTYRDSSDFTRDVSTNYYRETTDTETVRDSCSISFDDECSGSSESECEEWGGDICTYTPEETDEDGNITQEESCDKEGSPEANILSEHEYYDDGSDPYLDTDLEYTTYTWEYDELGFETSDVFTVKKQYQPESVQTSEDPEEILFEGENWEDETDIEVFSTILNDQTYYSIDAERSHYKDYGFGDNDKSVSLSTFSLDVNDEVEFVSVRDSAVSYNADGSEGFGNGMIAIAHELENEYRENEEKIDEEWSIVGSSIGVTDEDESKTDIPNYAILEDTLEEEYGEEIQCPEGQIYCIAYIDLSLLPLDEWGDEGDAVQPWHGLEVEALDISSKTMGVDESYGACHTFNILTDYDLDSDEEAQCDFEITGTSPTSPGKTGTANRWRHYMEGPEVNDLRDEHPGAYEGWIDNHGSCIAYGEEYPEGSMEDLNHPEDNIQYEAGGDSADKEVCLHTGPADEPGGKWYDLDHKKATEYIRSEGGEDADFESDEWKNYWQKNPRNPSIEAVEDSYYLDDAGGLAIEDNCYNINNPRYHGSDDFAAQANMDASNYQCEDKGSGTGFNPPFYAEFENEARSDDYDDDENFDNDINLLPYHSRAYIGELSSGNVQVTGLNEQADQTDESLDYMDNSQIDPENNVWGYVPDPAYGIGPDGQGYEPWKCHGPNVWDMNNLNSVNAGERDYVSKEERVFANSFIYAGGNVKGEHEDGVWVDPDDVNPAQDIESSESALDAGELFLTCDTNSLDWGMGHDDGSDNGQINSIQGTPTTSDYSGPVVVTGDITFYNDMNDGGSSSKPEQYGSTCGDDPNEYLVREHDAGGADYGDMEGMFGCAPSPDYCVKDGVIYEPGERADIAPDEAPIPSSDYEVCANLPNDGSPTGSWYDIDDPELREHIIGGGNIGDSETYRYYHTDKEDVLEGEVQEDKGWWHTRDTTWAVDQKWRSPYVDSYLYDQSIQDDVAGYALEPNVYEDFDTAGYDTSGETVSLIEDGAVYSFFKHGRGIPESNTREAHHEQLEAYSVTMIIEGEKGIGARSEQMDEGTEDLNWDSTNWGWPTQHINSSEIGPEENVWGVADTTEIAVGPTGEFYEPGRCYGPNVWEEDDNYVLKNETIVANTYVETADLGMESEYDAPTEFFSDENDAHWVNPDETVESARRGGVTCDLTSNSWGYGFNTGSGLDCEEGDCFENDFGPDNPHVVVGDIIFYNDVNEGTMEDAPEQYGDACGDDPNEYLIREHGVGNDEFNPDLEDDNIYGCAPTPDYCMYEGEIYEEGSLKDIGISDEEGGGHSPDREVCLNRNEDVPGGSWYDVDDWESTEHVRDAITDNGGDRDGALDSNEWQEKWRDHPDEDALDEPIDDSSLDVPEWVEHVDQVDEDEIPVPSTLLDSRGGFALEDNCQEGIECEDIDFDNSGYVWGNFDYRGSRPDDYEDGSYEVSLDIVHNRMVLSTEGDEGIGSSNPQDQETEQDLDHPFHQSQVNEEFNQWAYSDDLGYGVGPFGNIYESGMCHGAEREQGEDEDKTSRIFANSYVTDEGYWVDPDETVESVREGGFSCDLTGDDKGFGFNSPDYSDTDGDFEIIEEADDSDAKAIEGEIAFEESNQIYADACGDDPSEYLIEEAGESPNSNEWTGRWACVDEKDKCVSWDGDDFGDNEIFEQGEYHDTREPGEFEDRAKNDAEYCDRRSGDNQGVWYDQDYSQEYCRENTLHGILGKRWIDREELENHPHAFAGGIDDSWNPYLEDDRPHDSLEHMHPEEFEDDYGMHASNMMEEGYTPIPTGTLDEVAAVPDTGEDEYGFCGGDDTGEYLLTQECATSLCDTDRSVRGVGRRPGQCVLDGTSYDLEDDHNDDERKLYNTGESVTYDFDHDQRDMTCYGGTWFEEWPVAFVQDEVEVGLGDTKTVNFFAVNPENVEREIEISIEGDEEVGRFAEFPGVDDDTYTVTVEPETSTQEEIQIYGGTEDIGSGDQLEISGNILDSTIEGEDSLEVNVEDDGFEEGRSRGVSGIETTHVIAILTAATSIFYLFV